VSADYCGLAGGTSSKVGWEIFSVLPFKEKFFAMFDEFSAEGNFENKCRAD
jgi:hypothetical protein